VNVNVKVKRKPFLIWVLPSRSLSPSLSLL